MVLVENNDLKSERRALHHRKTKMTEGDSQSLSSGIFAKNHLSSFFFKFKSYSL